MKKIYSLLFLSTIVFILHGQSIPQHISYTQIYDFVDELANDGIIEINSAVKPYSRQFIADKMVEALQKKDALNNRQLQEVYFFLEEYAPEQNRVPEYQFTILENEKTTIGLVPPVFHYNDSLFRATIQPILGMNIFINQKGQINQRWWGVNFQSMIGKHISVYGSLRDNSFEATKDLNPRLSEPEYLTPFPGYEYKEPNDFSDSRGGVKLAWKWGSVGLVKDNVVWGDNYNGSNIISGRVPSFPMITLQLKPTSWFELNYIHGWLISNVVDSARFYVENGENRWYRNHNKYIAANMFTFTPIPKLNISFGNSIIYAEDNVQPGYLIPIAFYKSIDHLLTKGVATENQNSQLFFNVSSRNIKHLHLYSSVFFDEIKFSRFKSSSIEKNPISFKIGGRVSNFPFANLYATAEFTRTNIINYKHSIDALTYASNSYSLGHYLGDNAQEIHLALGYKPIRGLNLKVHYTNAQHGNEYNYVRRVDGLTVIRTIISQPTLNDIIWKNETVGFNAVYEVFNNAYAVVKIENSNIQSFDAKTEAILGEKRMTANETLNYFTPPFLQGNNTTYTVGFSFGF